MNTHAAISVHRRWLGRQASALIAIALLLPAGAAQACVGDCNGDGTVTINELITGVGIALSQTSVSACRAMDSNNDGRITIDELVAAVNSALDNCGMPGATPTPQTTSDVEGGSQAAIRASGIAQQPLVFSFGSVGAGGSGAFAGRSGLRSPRDMALLGRANTATPGSLARQAASDCLNVGGTEQTDCEQTADGFLFSATFVQCESVESGGVDVVRDGLLQVMGPQEVCEPMTLDGTDFSVLLTQYTEQDTDPSGVVTTSSWGQNGVFEDAHAESTMLGCNGQPFISEGLAGDFSIHVSQDAAVYLDRHYTYDHFIVTMGMGYFFSQTVCESGLAVNGGITLVDQLTGDDVSQTYGTSDQFEDSFFIYAVVNPDGSLSVNEQGGISSACFGSVQIATVNDLTFPSADAACPVAGTLQVTLGGSVDVVRYSPNGIDFNGDGVPDVSSCTDPALTVQCRGGQPTPTPTPAPTATPTEALAQMTLDVGNGCLGSGSPIEFRFFDQTNKIEYPNTPQPYGLDAAGSSVTIACRPGALVCYGAGDSAGLLSWGVGLDGTRPCGDCCSTCGNTTVSFTLACGAASIQLADGCPDGLALEFAIFDRTSGTTYPGGGQVYIVSSGGSGFANVTCVSNDQLCFGAQPYTSTPSIYWGVGLDGTQICADACCINCPGPDAAPAVLEQDLICQ
jgi:EF hand